MRRGQSSRPTTPRCGRCRLRWTLRYDRRPDKRTGGPFRDQQRRQQRQADARRSEYVHRRHAGRRNGSIERNARTGQRSWPGRTAPRHQRAGHVEFRIAYFRHVRRAARRRQPLVGEREFFARYLAVGGNGCVTTLSGDLSGDGSLIENAPGAILVLSGDNSSFLGATTIVAGTFEAASPGALPGYVGDNGTVSVQGGATLAVAADGWLSSDIHTLLQSGDFLNGANLGVDTESETLTYPYSISDPALDCSLGIVVFGGGTLVLSGTNNTYSGGSDLEGAIVQLGDGAGLGSGTLIVNGGVLDLNGQNITVGSLEQQHQRRPDHQRQRLDGQRSDRRSRRRRDVLRQHSGRPRRRRAHRFRQRQPVLERRQRLQRGHHGFHTLTLASPNALADNTALTVAAGGTLIFGPQGMPPRTISHKVQIPRGPARAQFLRRISSRRQCKRQRLRPDLPWGRNECRGPGHVSGTRGTDRSPQPGTLDRRHHPIGLCLARHHQHGPAGQLRHAGRHLQQHGRRRHFRKACSPTI